MFKNPQIKASDLYKNDDKRQLILGLGDDSKTDSLMPMLLMTLLDDDDCGCGCGNEEGEGKCCGGGNKSNLMPFILSNMMNGGKGVNPMTLMMMSNSSNNSCGGEDCGCKTQMI